MPQRKKKLIAVIRNEMGLEMSKAFATVTRLELEFFRCKSSSEDITDLFTQLYHIVSQYPVSCSKTTYSNIQ